MCLHKPFERPQRNPTKARRLTLRQQRRTLLRLTRHRRQGKLRRMAPVLKRRRRQSNLPPHPGTFPSGPLARLRERVRERVRPPTQGTGRPAPPDGGGREGDTPAARTTAVGAAVAAAVTGAAFPTASAALPAPARPPPRPTPPP